MDKQSIAARIEDIVGLLKSAQDHKGAYELHFHRPIEVSREEFLDYYITEVIDNLWELKERLENDPNTNR